MVENTIRTGRVSSIDYQAGTYEVTYFDRGKSVTQRINAMSNGEYKMPRIGQIVSVSHNSNGPAAAVTTGTIWNKSNPPAEGFEGLYRKEYGEAPGQAYERYDAKHGVYTQFTDGRTGRNCNGEIFDEAKGPITLAAGGAVQVKSDDSSVSIQGKTGVGLGAEKSVTIDAGESISLETGGDMDEGVGGDRALSVEGENTETYKDKVTREFLGDIKDTVAAKVELTITGEVKLNINGVQLTITEEGDITIQSEKKIAVTAQEITLTGSTSSMTF